jgi:hypothetical protein
VGINAVTFEDMDVTLHQHVMNGVSVQMKLAKDCRWFRAIEFNCYRLDDMPQERATC